MAAAVAISTEPFENGEVLSEAEFRERKPFAENGLGARQIEGGTVLIAFEPGRADDGTVMLQNGDCFDQPEFHDRYEQCEELRHCELLDGVVYMSSPQRVDRHADQQHLMQVWLGMYAMPRPDLRATGPATVILGRRSEPEPDALMFRRSRGIVSERGYVSGPPDLVVEVAASSRSRDYHQKMRIYAAAGIPEYVVWDVRGRVIDWFVLRGGGYERKIAGQGGIYESEQFPGLRLDVDSALRLDLAGVIAALGPA